MIWIVGIGIPKNQELFKKKILTFVKIMDYNKTKILKESRELLQLLKCEIVVDISDTQLFNVLFQSDVKKETLLKWLLQQMYSLGLL